MAGALAERVFVDKMTSVGFRDVEVLGRQPFSINDAASYPLFTPDLIELMTTLLPPAEHAEVAVAVMVAGKKTS